ncbi:hypothetical protein ARMGADRAFT_1147505 [Armillaria gallica]|uniref:Uncharacterized protein n=1 Tax=Armillaria gallica TaxID=47427 RepID=A0A2H3CC84_ARMGA|nr:hypothetical protein ARMGADRAFT_1147505 [Armillaria gallica]
MSIDCPSLPEKSWTAILQDDAVDFSEIFASINTATIDKEITVEIGEGVSIMLDSTKSSNKITKHGHWVIAWQAYTKATNAYMRHVNKLFSVCHSSLHYRVINYDRAARIIIGSRHDILFLDFHEFMHEKTAYIDSVGTAVVHNGGIQEGHSQIETGISESKSHHLQQGLQKLQLGR